MAFQGEYSSSVTVQSKPKTHATDPPMLEMGVPWEQATDATAFEL